MLIVVSNGSDQKVMWQVTSIIQNQTHENDVGNNRKDTHLFKAVNGKNLWPTPILIS